MAQQYPLIPKLYGYQMQENEELRQLYILMEKWGSTLINELNTVPKLVEDIITQHKEIEKIASKYKDASNFFFRGRQ